MPTSMLVLLPFVAAMCYGIGYVLIERVVGIHINTATFYAINTVICILVLLWFVFWQGESVDFKTFSSATAQTWLLIIMAAAIPCLGWVFTIYAIRHTSAVFTAFAETSYPIFTMAFGFLLFGIRQVNPATIIGGVIIFMGAVIMVYGQNIGQSDE